MKYFNFKILYQWSIFSTQVVLIRLLRYMIRGILYINKKAKCSCQIKEDIYPIEKIKFDKEKLKKNFIDINNIANIKFMKCYKIVFKKNNIKHNLGFYIMNSIFLSFFLCLFLFYCRYYNLLINEIIGLIFIHKKHSNCKNINSNKKKLLNSSFISSL